jgi:hypothetical protein
VNDYAAQLATMIKPTQLCYQSATLFNSKYHHWSSLLFATRLVSRGGSHVDLPPPPPIDVDAINDILDKGRFYDGEIATVVDDSTPDDDIADMVGAVLEDPSAFHLYAGYALHADGVWRFQDWIYNSGNDTILDSVPAKTLYYGALIATGTAESAKQVAASLINIEDDEI